MSPTHRRNQDRDKGQGNELVNHGCRPLILFPEKQQHRAVDEEIARFDQRSKPGGQIILRDDWHAVEI